MKRNKVAIMCLSLFFMFSGVALSGDKTLKMSTTTSTVASGLLDVLLPVFKEDTGITVNVIAKGTGAAIRDGMDGNVDVIFVHAREREEQFVKQGYGTKRYAVMHNDFVIVGPTADPAGIKGMKNAAEALQKIVTAGALFVSRGDDSGTHTKEQALWKATGVPLISKTDTIVKKGVKREVGFVHPDGLGRRYLSIGQGMGKTMTFTDEKQGYTLTDRGTYIKYRYGREIPVDLVVLCEGDPLLVNPYGIIPINPKKHSHAQYELAKQFADWLTSVKGQTLIAGYRLHDRQLFYADAQE